MKQKIKKILKKLNNSELLHLSGVIEEEKEKMREKLKSSIDVGEKLLTLEEFQKPEIKKTIERTIKKAKKDIEKSYK